MPNVRTQLIRGIDFVFIRMIKYQFSVYQADDSRKWSQFLCAFSGECFCGKSKFR